MNNKNRIYVLLVNMQLLTSGTMLTRDDYDYGVEGYFKPFDAIKFTKPIVIIDEPHRFSKDQQAYKKIVSEIKPQFIIRYGATFPEIAVGKGRNKVIVKDYGNLLYDLKACDAFNQNLIKGVAKEHFEPLSKKYEKVKIVDIQSKTNVKFSHIKDGENTKQFLLTTGDMLSRISMDFGSLSISGIGKDFVELSNGQIKYQGEEIDVDIYSESYQEQMLRLAIERHFETEKNNFDRKNKIKTLALFFIDDISSYRTAKDSEKAPYLKIAFEKILSEKIEDELAKLTPYDEEYKKYMIASKKDISACHMGYFSQDNDDSDEKIAEEVNDILYNKKKLLSLKDEAGNYNTGRFLFSKWTLKEGWDNPNIFTITKLRSSGCENSKLQEVGRGLRLPVDENGTRISNEEFRLNYIVDFTEANFAQQLVDQINADAPEKMSISDEKLNEVAKKLLLEPDDLFFDLFSKKYIDRNKVIKQENRDKFFAEYPDFTNGITKGKVQDRNKEKPKSIKIRAARYNELKTLWDEINKRYLLYYDASINVELLDIIDDIFEKGVFSEVILSSKRELVNSNGQYMVLAEDSGVQYTIEHPIPYNEFLKRINKATNIPILVIHNAMLKFSKKHGQVDKKFINKFTVDQFISEFNDWKNENLQGRFQYKKANIKYTSTALTHSDGTPKSEILQGKIGTKIADGTPSDKYLYDAITYDSPLEKENIMSEIESVVVYGKIPRNSVAIPTITGGTYSPDFMYVVKKQNGEKELNIVVETKDVEGKSDLRGIEKTKIDCAEVFFKQLTIDGYTVSFHKQLNNKKMKSIIDEVLGK